MPAKTPARPAEKPVGRRVMRKSGAKQAAEKRVAESKSQSKSKAKRKAKPESKSSNTGVKPDIAHVIDSVVQPNSKAVSLVKHGRHVPSKILHDDLSAPVSTLLARVSSAIEDELTQIEMIVSGGVKLRERAQAERRARTLASLARTLREVMQLRAGEEKTKRDDDAVPRDIGELRRELARRLDKIVTAAKTAHPGEPG